MNFAVASPTPRQGGVPVTRTTSVVSTVRTRDRSLQADLWLVVTLGAALSALEQIFALL